ncbi:MAG: nuclear transport factor 2 family protein [Verrucomicrobiales bacterium]|nr:nuclear transport factor 2 family protein [Verrucomicrobiales bacterium]
MKTLIALCLFLPLFVHAEEKPQLSTLIAADDSRLAAMKSADGEKLTAVMSDELRYAHSSGVVDTKASFIDSLTSGKLKYVGVDYVERNFSFPAPSIAMMTGSAKFKLNTPNGEIEPTLAFLAVWRLEAGQWRFLAWQSCKLP